METFTCVFQVTTLISETRGSVFFKSTVIFYAYLLNCIVVKSETSCLSYYETLFSVHLPLKC